MDNDHFAFLLQDMEEVELWQNDRARSYLLRISLSYHIRVRVRVRVHAHGGAYKSFF